MSLNIDEKAIGETQTLRAGCSKAEPKNFTPPQTPFPGAQDGQNLISWRWSLLYLLTQFGEDRCTQFRVIVVTDPQTNKQTNPQINTQTHHKQTGPITIHCAAKLSAPCNNIRCPSEDGNIIVAAASETVKMSNAHLAAAL